MKYAANTEPYPGLRPFRRDEVNIFFGRDDHVSEMVEKLGANHFLCITGPSGCGKSSLAKTGLMNALEAGFLSGTGSDWVYVDMRPGDNPLPTLYMAMAKAIVEDSDYAQEADELAQLIKNHVELRSHDLTEAIDLIEGARDRPHFILVDQFEELFRFAQADPHAAVTFVDVLLRTIAARKNIYVAITIRTDELEKCSRYSGLTGAINTSQFLTPTLDRFQIQEAIEGPISVVGGIIEPDLSIWLLNSVEKLLDKLPLLQHALKLLYTRKLNARNAQALGKQQGPGEGPGSENAAGISIGLDDFAQAFGIDTDLSDGTILEGSLLRKSLSIELDRIYASLDEDIKPGARHLFCALTDTQTHGRDIRRPRSIRQLADSIGLSVADTWTVIMAFSYGDVAYLYVKENENDRDNSIVDVTHECVLRLWGQLQNDWLVEEQRSADNVRFLAAVAKNFEEERRARPVASRILGGNALTGSTLDRYTHWIKQTKPTAQWAERYLNSIDWPPAGGHPGADAISTAEKFSRLTAFLSYSRRRSAGIRTVFVMLAALIFGGSLAWFYLNAEEAKFAAKRAEKEVKMAKNAEALAKDAEALAERKLEYALKSIDNNIESEDPLGKTLYARAAPENSECSPQDAFCKRLTQNTAAKKTLGKLQTLYSTPLCSNLNNMTSIARLGSDVPAFCTRHPPVSQEIAGPPKPVSDTDQSIWAFGSSLLRQKAPTKQQARSIFFSLARAYPANPRFFRALSRGYLYDGDISDARRFSEANSCFTRAIAVACSPGSNAHSLYINVNTYVEDILENIYVGDKIFNLVGERIALKMMLSTEFLDANTLDKDIAASEMTRERLSRLWRGFDTTSDAARDLRQHFECSQESAAKPQCTIVPMLYKRATEALALVVKYGRTDPSSKSQQTAIAYGVGIGALHWGQDPEFRKIAKLTISQSDLIRELEKAYQSRKSPRYPTGLAMLYCLDGQFDKARTTADAIRDDRRKYASVREQVHTCAQSPDIENHFNAAKPSE